MGINFVNPRRRKEEPPFTPEADEALKRLESFRESGWNLTNRTTEELDAIDADLKTVGAGRCSRERNLFSYSSKLMQDARDALRIERLRRENQRDQAIREQQDRIHTIIAAATTMELAAEQMEKAEGIEDRRDIIPRYTVEAVTTEQAHGMDDRALASVADMNERQAELVAGKNLDEYEHAASVLEKNGGARGKRLARVLREEAEHFRDDLEAHRANAATARAELDARAKRAEDRQQAMDSVAETTANVDELLARVADLEARLSGESKQ